MAKKDIPTAKTNVRTNPTGKRVSNAILLSVSDSEYRTLRPHLEFLDLPGHLSLYEPNAAVEFVYFPNAGMVSLVIEMEDGRTVEVGEVGKEGFAGIEAVVGMKRSQVREVVQIAGDGFRVRIGALLSVLPSNPQFQLILARYAVGQGMQLAQTAACNRLHNIEQRFARWLLITQDRVDSATFAISQDFLAMMLGTDRPTVSLAAGMLRKKRVIEWTRLRVQILSRAKLEKCACECYAVVHQDRYGETRVRQGKASKPRTRADA